MREAGYGFFPGGDPNDFYPDPECSTERERRLWRIDCYRYTKGKPLLVDARRRTERFGEDGWISIQPSGYGLGSYTFDAPDDWYDAVSEHCEGNPATCQCQECSDLRESYEAQTMERFRDATSSRVLPPEDQEPAR